MATVTLERLTCAFDGHTWERQPTRGRKPTFCPEHNSTQPVRAPSTGTQTLHCEIGNHDWERPSQRGVKPKNCPEHKPVQGSGRVVHTVQMNSAGQAVRTLHCEAGNHSWERPSQRGRAPINCPEHAAVRSTPRNTGLMDIPEDELPLVEVEGDYESETTPEEQKELLQAAFAPKTKSPEQIAEEKRLKAEAVVDQLEANLKARGTHISQQTPYILYKRIGEPTARGRTTWEKVADHSPLMRAKFLNEHEADFLAKRYRYEREGKVLSDDE